MSYFAVVHLSGATHFGYSGSFRLTPWVFAFPFLVVAQVKDPAASCLPHVLH